jgi:histidinol phosphatase-like enzyme (inositol monophosphatase family)
MTGVLHRAMTQPSDDQIAELLDFAERLCAAAQRETLPRFRGDVPVDNKLAAAGGGPRAFDPVTEADRAAETAISAMIDAAYPDHGVQGEEHGVKAAKSPYEWTLDPIDGTRAFISGLPLWTTLIALSYEGRPLIGIIDQPYLGERYVGWPGGAAFRRGSVRRPLKVRPCPRLSEATISTTDPHLFDGAEAGGFEQVRRASRLARYGCDAYAYAQVAAGHMDLAIESGLKPWDVRALVPVVEGAGGLVTDWRGETAWDGGQVIAAGDARAHADALVALKRAAK